MDFCRLSAVGRLGFIWLWSNADDEGRVKADADVLQFNRLPATLEEIDHELGLMESQRMIRRYRVDGTNYVFVVNFLKHQHIEWPTASRLPAPPPEGADVTGWSPVDDTTAQLRELATGTSDAPQRVTNSPVRNRGEEGDTSPPGSGTGSSSTPTGVLLARGDSSVRNRGANAEDVDRVWEAYRWALTEFAAHRIPGVPHPNPAQVKLTPARRDGIVSRLGTRAGTYPVEDLVDAARGWLYSVHHVGWNDRHEHYCDLIAHVLWTGGKGKPKNWLEAFRDLWRERQGQPFAFETPPAEHGAATATTRRRGAAGVRDEWRESMEGP
jgi:hypothetical protein